MPPASTPVTDTAPELFESEVVVVVVDVVDDVPDVLELLALEVVDVPPSFLSATEMRLNRPVLDSFGTTGATRKTAKQNRNEPNDNSEKKIFARRDMTTK